MGGGGEEEAFCFSVIFAFSTVPEFGFLKEQFVSEVGYLELGPQREMGELIPSVNMGHGKFLEAELVPGGPPLCF